MPSRVVECIEWNKICFFLYYPCDVSYVQKKAADVPHETCLWGTLDTVKCNESDLTENGCWYRLNVFAHILHSPERIQFPAWLHIKCIIYVQSCSNALCNSATVTLYQFCSWGAWLRPFASDFQHHTAFTKCHSLTRNGKADLRQTAT